MFRKRRALAGLLAALGLASAPVGGCSRSKGADPAQVTDAGPDAEPLAPAESAAAAPPSPPSPSSSAEAASAPEIKAPEGRPAPPEGYVTMKVMNVVVTSQGNAVLLADEAEERIVPIFVGGTEGLSIELRLRTKRYQRPLTHDLLDSLVGKLGGELVKVQVDAIRGSVFVGSVFVKQAGKLIEVDARPSDAIALALGKRAPIFVAEKVLDASSIKKRDLLRDDGDPDRVELPPAPPEPMTL
ncbi:MAG TPA: bifunctional nuclease family protein [Polyangiaceae bacterium]|nr:bifunctional nuclease family protein [Polyangiaceae bacterium]